MASKKLQPPSSRGRGKVPLQLLILFAFCFFFYFLGVWQRSGSGKGDSLAIQINQQQPPNCTLIPSPDFKSHHTLTPSRDFESHHKYEEPVEPSESKASLDFESHHKYDEPEEPSEPDTKVFEMCDAKYTDYTPCQDPDHAMKLSRENMFRRERHCPPKDKKLRCLIPAPKGYTTPFPWPKSRDFVYYSNVPFKSLTVQKGGQNWVKYEGKVFRFPGGGTMFRKGADAYIDELATVIPLADGSIRTALDTGCGVASWGAYMLKRNVMTMSFAPRDSHEAQVQFALERGVPAVIGVLGTIKLPYPSRSFDVAQCSRCLIPWTFNDGMYLMEVDRVLRPGGYWVLSGPPINWRTYYQAWRRSKEDLKAEQTRIEELAELLCWEKKYEKGGIAIWRKKLNGESCNRKSANFCESSDNDDVWYKEMEKCITPFPEVESPNDVAGGELKKFPARLFDVPPRVRNGDIPGVTPDSYEEDSELWKKHVKAYKRIDKLIGTTRYRNIMDMNAGLGGFAAAMESSNLWVMNAVPSIARNTLGVIYERGLIGIYHDWCEGFSTYPRTYDLIHANGVFKLYQDECELEDILLEMDRILRPGGTVILRDEVDLLNNVKKIAGGMRWETRLLDHEEGPLVPEKVLVAVK